MNDLTVMPRVPLALHELKSLAEYVADSDLVPKDFRGKPANCAIAIQMGMEVGLSWANALQSIAVINGRPSIWGDAALALVMAHPDFAGIDESGCTENEGVCTIRRKPSMERTHRFSLEDARRAKLLEKDTYKQHQGRMLQRRARARAMADLFPDALKGLALREEIGEIIDVTPVRAGNVPGGNAGEAATGEQHAAETPARPRHGIAAVREKLAARERERQSRAAGDALDEVLKAYAAATTPAEVTAIDERAAKLPDEQKQAARDARKGRIRELVESESAAPDA